MISVVSLMSMISVSSVFSDFSDFGDFSDFNEFGNSNDFNDFGELNDSKKMKLTTKKPLFERRLRCVLSNELYLVPHTVPLAADLKKKWSQPGELEC